MKKAIFTTEISLLKTTIERLLRRKAGSNLTKIIRNTHPADIALLMRGFSTENQKIVNPSSWNQLLGKEKYYCS